MFGVSAEFLIDHAWGYEPCEIKDVKNYRPRSSSFSSGQVLKEPYDFGKARVVADEMADETALMLLAKKLTTDQIVLTVGYDKVSLLNYHGDTTTDFYGREIPKHAHGTFNLGAQTASSQMIREAVLSLFDKLVDKDLFVRRITIDINHVLPEDTTPKPKQLDLFGEQKNPKELEKEKRVGKAIIKIKERYGKNAILKGINFEEGATGRERHTQIRGHRG